MIYWTWGWKSAFAWLSHPGGWSLKARAGVEVKEQGAKQGLWKPPGGCSATHPTSTLVWGEGDAQRMGNAGNEQVSRLTQSRALGGCPCLAFCGAAG